MTQEELVLGGAVVGSMFGVTIAIIIAIWILLIIAWWKIFTKAGIAGWKSLIPIYNIYLLYKISNVNFWIWAAIPYVLIYIITISYPDGSQMPTLLAFLLFVIVVFYIVGCWKMSRGLAKSFGKGIGFTLGLFFLTNIFYLILGFGSAKYVGHKSE